ncbi:hypothetical protein KJN74_00050 [Candidatus Bathyarchaeota archaeon]|nr:hypothetical protein [Candidatus Bathyarchaeota archaeon]
MKNMNTLKPYMTVNPLKAKKKNEDLEIPKTLSKEILHKIKLIEKAFR